MRTIAQNAGACREHEIILEHMMEGEAAAMKELSEEMAKLHDEFKDMQKELKELKKQ